MRQYTINIDAGHGRFTRGKRSPDGSYLEWEGNRKFARALEIYMTDAGREVNNIMGNCEIAVGLKQRAEFCNKIPHSLYIAGHSNASTNSGWGKARGHVVWYYKGSKNGERLARCISARLAQVKTPDGRFIPNRGIKGGRRLYMTNKTDAPAVIVERFFHDNKEDLELGMLLVDPQAAATAAGVRDFERGKFL